MPQRHRLLVQRAAPAASALAKPRPARASGTERRRYGDGDANRTRLCTLLGSSTSSKLCANPLQAYQSTVWPNRDGLLGLRRPPSFLNRTCIRAQGARRLVARTAWPYCTWGGAATVCALSRPLKVPSLPRAPTAHCNQLAAASVPHPNLDSTAIPWPGQAPLVCLPSTAKNKTVPNLAWRQSLRFSSSCLHDSTDLLNFFFSSSLVVQLPRLRGENEGKSSID